MDDPTESYSGDFDSWAEWFAARYQLRGSKALKTTLSELVATGQCHREVFWQPAAELMAMGLRRPATMVRNASLKCASLTDLDKFWPYNSGRDDPANIRAATASAERRIKDCRRKTELLLRQVGLGLDWLGEKELSASGELSQEGANYQQRGSESL
jgi:hypothetical protein